MYKIKSILNEPKSRRNDLCDVEYFMISYSPTSKTRSCYNSITEEKLVFLFYDDTVDTSSNTIIRKYCPSYKIFSYLSTLYVYRN